MDNIMKTELPDFILEMSKQMSAQPARSTSHPFWQVRCKRYVITQEGYNEHHWILQNDDGEFFNSRSDVDGCPTEALLENYPEFCKQWGIDYGVDFLESYDIEIYDELPGGVNKLFMQEIEEVVTTHLTEADANWFIKRKQHDYPKLYTWVESAYWSPQLKELQDWIISLSA